MSVTQYGCTRQCSDRRRRVVASIMFPRPTSQVWLAGLCLRNCTPPATWSTPTRSPNGAPSRRCTCCTDAIGCRSLCFRPSVVVGHRQTGWAHRNGFGFYMFLEGMMAIAKAGLSELAVGVVPDTRTDLVSIDQ